MLDKIIILAFLGAVFVSVLGYRQYVYIQFSDVSADVAEAEVTVTEGESLWGKSLLETFTSMPELFTFFSLSWWLLLFATSGGIIYFIHEEKGLQATGVLAGSILALLLFGGLSLSALWENLYSILGFFAGYVVIGAIWGCGGRWALHLMDVKLQYKEDLQSWLRENGVSGSVVPNELKNQWKMYLQRPTSPWSTESGELKIVPSAWDNKLKISRWMAFWPWSMAWEIIDNLIWKVFTRIRVLLSELMDNFALYWFRGIENDYTEEPADEAVEPVETPVEAE